MGGIIGSDNGNPGAAGERKKKEAGKSSKIGANGQKSRPRGLEKEGGSIEADFNLWHRRRNFDPPSPVDLFLLSTEGNEAGNAPASSRPIINTRIGADGKACGSVSGGSQNRKHK